MQRKLGSQSYRKGTFISDDRETRTFRRFITLQAKSLLCMYLFQFCILKLCIQLHTDAFRQRQYVACFVDLGLSLDERCVV